MAVLPVLPKRLFGLAEKPVLRAHRALAGWQKRLCGSAEEPFLREEMTDYGSRYACLCMTDAFIPLPRFCFADSRCRVFLLPDCIFMHFRRYVAVARRGKYAASHICILCGNAIAVTE